jgi:hypothetical protein
MRPGPEELDKILGPPTRLAEILKRNDPEHKLVQELKISPARRPSRVRKWSPPPPEKAAAAKSVGGTWSSGPWTQFGVTAFLCEGGGGLYSKKENVDSGAVLIKSLMEYYKGARPALEKSLKEAES